MQDREGSGPFAVFEEIHVDDGPVAADGEESTATTCAFSFVHATRVLIVGSACLDSLHP